MATSVQQLSLATVTSIPGMNQMPPLSMTGYLLLLDTFPNTTFSEDQHVQTGKDVNYKLG